jgi:hypothetical protein
MIICRGNGRLAWDAFQEDLASSWVASNPFRYLDCNMRVARCSMYHGKIIMFDVHHSASVDTMLMKMIG